MNKYDEAIECYNKALDINPNLAGAWNNKGIAYYKMNKYDEAIECFIKSISLFILQNEDKSLIKFVTYRIIEIINQHPINEEIKDIAIIIYVSLYLIRDITREECINEIKDLRGSSRGEALIHAVVNNEDRHIAINNTVDEAFNDLKRYVLKTQNNNNESNSNNR